MDKITLHMLYLTGAFIAGMIVMRFGIETTWKSMYFKIKKLYDELSKANLEFMVGAKENREASAKLIKAMQERIECLKKREGRYGPVQRDT